MTESRVYQNIGKLYLFVSIQVDKEVSTDTIYIFFVADETLFTLEMAGKQLKTEIQEKPNTSRQRIVQQPGASQ